MKIKYDEQFVDVKTVEYVEKVKQGKLKKDKVPIEMKKEVEELLGAF